MDKWCLNIGGRLVEKDRPSVMGIINMTPDSFAVSCKSMAEEEAVRLAEKMLMEGADILDIGGMSTRPGAHDVNMEEEWCRVRTALVAIRHRYPDVLISVDTFRAEVAERSMAEGANIINDVSGGCDEMSEVLVRMHAPYILTSPVGAEQTLGYLARKLDELHRAGVADVIIDPGYGFGKMLEENYTLLRRQDELKVLGCPILAGISRKSMIYKTLGCTPSEALNGTTALDMVALMHGADILRVHDVREAVETIKLYRGLLGLPYEKVCSE